MPQVLHNNLTGRTTGSITNVATSVTLQSGHGFPDPGTDYYLATLISISPTTGLEDDWEIVQVTNVAADVLTIVRGQEGTTNRAWDALTDIQVRITAATIILDPVSDGNPYVREDGAWALLSVKESDIDHDQLLNYLANEHIDWTAASAAFSTSGTAATGPLTVTGNIIVTGTVDGRDIATDAALLDSTVLLDGSRELTGNLAFGDGGGLTHFIYVATNDGDDDDILWLRAGGLGGGSRGGSVGVYGNEASPGALSGSVVLEAGATGDVRIDCVNNASGSVILTPGSSASVDCSDSPITNVESVNFGAEDLNNYSETTFTPYLTDGTNDSPAATIAAGWTTRIGREVFFHIRLALNGLGSVSGDVSLSGFPWGISTATNYRAAFTVSDAAGLNITAGQVVGCYGAAGGGIIFPLTLWDAATGTTPLQASEVSSDGDITVSGSYITA